MTFYIINSGVNTNLTNYKVSCKSLMQLSRKSSHKPGTNLSDFSYNNLLLDGIQDGFVISFSKKKEMYLYFRLENILSLFGYENDFQEKH